MPRHLIRFFIRYKYQVIFPIAVLEGPIITMISGFLISLGYLSFVPTFCIVFAGDLISDSFLYGIGRFGRNVVQKIPFIRISGKRINQLEEQYRAHPGKTIAASKVSYGLGWLFLIAAGASKMTYRIFAQHITIFDAIKSSALLMVGYFFGRAALHFSNTYLQYYALAVIILLPVIYYAIEKNRALN